jgi:hypothetical protein
VADSRKPGRKPAALLDLPGSGSSSTRTPMKKIDLAALERAAAG